MDREILARGAARLHGDESVISMLEEMENIIMNEFLSMPNWDVDKARSLFHQAKSIRGLWGKIESYEGIHRREYSGN